MEEESEWDTEAVYADWKASKLTQAAYCNREGISYVQFKNKSYKQRRQSREKDSISVCGQFNEVSLGEEMKSESHQPYCEISFSGEHKVSFSDKASLAGLKSLISDLIQL